MIVESWHRTKEATRPDEPGSRVAAAAVGGGPGAAGGSRSEKGRVVRAFHRRLPGYAATPIVELPELAKRLGVATVHLKYEKSRLGLPSFKSLGASWAIYVTLADHLGYTRAEMDGLWEDWDGLRAVVSRALPLTLVAATDGNHGRAVARMAALLGLEAHIFVPTGMAAARRDAIRGEGARVDEVAGDYDHAVEVAAKTASERRLVISDTSWPGYEQVPSLISDGYLTIFDEVAEQIGPARGPEVVVVPVGVGAFALAAARHYAADRNGRGAPDLISVEPSGAQCLTRSLQAGAIRPTPGPHHSIMAGLNCGVPSALAWEVLRDRVTSSFVVEDEDAVRGMRYLAGVGVAAGETGAATVGALLAIADQRHEGVIRWGPQTRVVTVCTEAVTDPRRYADIVGRHDRS